MKKIILLRENNEFSHSIIFEENKKGLKNKERILKETGAHRIKILEKDELLGYNVLVKVY